MKSNLFLRVISVLMLLICLTAEARAAISAPQAKAWAEDNGRLLLETFREADMVKRYAKLDVLLEKFIDLPYVARFVVGRFWREMSAEQQAVYQALFRRYALALYKTFPLDFVNDLSYEVGAAVVEKNDTVVTAVVHVRLNPNNPPQDFVLQFRLRETADGIKLADIKLAESSLILSYRSRFYELIAADDGDMGWFIEDFETMVQSAEKHSAEILSHTQNSLENSD